MFMTQTKTPIRETIKTADVTGMKLFVESLHGNNSDDVDGDEFFGYDPKNPFGKLKEMLNRRKS